MTKFVTVQPNRYNLYLEDVTFPQATSEGMRRVQLAYAHEMVETFACVEATDPSKQIYLKALKYMEEHQDEYSITPRDLNKKMITIMKAFSKLIKGMASGDYFDGILKRGYSQFNNKFFEDVANLKINVVKYIGGIIQIAESLERIAY